jgi:inosine/xanthosine triphosphatase
MTSLIVASTNPVKIDAARIGFQRMFPDAVIEINGVSVPSGVNDQPMTSSETLQGATNRARNAAALHPEADFVMGIEGGIQPDENGALQTLAWVVVLAQGQLGRAQTGIFILPDEIAQLIKQGMELGHADDAVFGRRNSKQQNGSIGLLTDDALTRTDYYVQAVIMALIPFKKPELTWK